jgi:hypothetical protein
MDFFVGRYSPRFDYPGAIPHFIRAAQLDTSFNLPLIWLTFAYGNSGNRSSADSVIRILSGRHDRLSALDRNALEYFLARGNVGEMLRWASEASVLAPASNWTHMRATLSSALGRDDEAIAAFRQLDGDQSWIMKWVFYWERYAQALHDAGRLPGSAGGGAGRRTTLSSRAMVILRAVHRIGQSWRYPCD